MWSFFIDSVLICFQGSLCWNPLPQKFSYNPSSKENSNTQVHDQISPRDQGGALTFVTPTSSCLLHEFNLRQCAVRRWPLAVHMCHRSNRQDDRFLITGNLESCFWNCWIGSTLCCGSGLVLLVSVCVPVFVCWVFSVCGPLFVLLVHRLAWIL